jgi:hypothetical protein
MTLQPVAAGIWTARAPLRFLSFEIGTRMTVVRLPDGSLLVHSPIRLDAVLRKDLDALGPVRHVVCPNLFHHTFAGPVLEAYPEAVLHAPAALGKKRRDLTIGRALGPTPPAEWQGALVPVSIEGSMMNETVLFHEASGTLVSSDLLEYFASCDELWTRTYLRAAGVYQKATWNRLLRFLYRDRRAARRSIDRLLELPVERISIAHGDLIERDARDVLRDGFAWL